MPSLITDTGHSLQSNTEINPSCKIFKSNKETCWFYIKTQFENEFVYALYRIFTRNIKPAFSPILIMVNNPLKYRTGVKAPVRFFWFVVKNIYWIRLYMNRYRVDCSTICHFTGEKLLKVTIKIEMSFIRLSQHHTESKKENLSNQQKKKESVLWTVKQNSYKNKLKPSKLQTEKFTLRYK